MVADVGVRITRGPDELVVGLQARLLLLLLTRRRAGMNVRTTARAVHADQRVGTRVVIAATLVQVPHCNQPRRGSRDPDHVHSGAGGAVCLVDANIPRRQPVQKYELSSFSHSRDISGFRQHLLNTVGCGKL